MFDLAQHRKFFQDSLIPIVEGLYATTLLQEGMGAARTIEIPGYEIGVTCFREEVTQLLVVTVITTLTNPDLIQAVGYSRMIYVRCHGQQGAELLIGSDGQKLIIQQAHPIDADGRVHWHRDRRQP